MLQCHHYQDVKNISFGLQFPEKSSIRNTEYPSLSRWHLGGWPKDMTEFTYIRITTRISVQRLTYFAIYVVSATSRHTLIQVVNATA